jgi:ribonuclease HII
MSAEEMCAWARALPLSRARDALALLAADGRRCAARAAAIIEKRLAEDRAELSRLRRMYVYEREAWRDGPDLVAGVDEAGRGPLAGPVIAAAVILKKRVLIRGLNDSKQTLPETREALFDEIMKRAVAVGVGIKDVRYIDRHNIAQAAFAAMRDAVSALEISPKFVLVDGFVIPNLQFPQRAIIKGDALSCSIAAASIIAKVTRDRMMVELDRKYPLYGFAQHKGYTTRRHLLSLIEHGACPEHRRSFLPVLQSQLALQDIDEQAK